MGKRVLTILVFFFLSTSIMKAQSVEFSHLTINDGLSQNAVHSIAQDKKGFMWFGTKDGLNRYDGQSFKVFRHNPDDSTTISDNNILALHLDRRGWLWAGTQQGGLNYYKPEKNTFSKLDHLSVDSGQIIRDQIYVVKEDQQGNIWVGTRMNGLFLIKRNSETGTPESVTNFRHQKGKPGSLFDNQIFDILIDEEGDVWIGTDRAVSRYLPESQAFEHFEISLQFHIENDYQFYYSISSLYPAPNGKLWLGTSEGLMLFNKSTGETELFPQRNESGQPFYRRIRKITEDKQGNLWLATPHGLGIFNPVTSEYRYYESDPFDASTISYHSITSMYKSRNDIMWLGTAGMGIDIYNPNSSRFSTFKGIDFRPDLSSFSIRDVLEDRSGNVWMVTQKLYQWNRADHTLDEMNDLFVPDNLENETIEIWNLIEDKQGVYWAASTDGLLSRKPKSGQVTFYEFSPDITNGLPQREVYYVFEDRKGEIWVITENYLCHLLEPENGVFRSYRFNPSDSVREQIRPAITEDQSGNFWIGTSIGLLYFNRDSESFVQYVHDPEDPTSLSHNLIKSILPDPEQPDRFLWVGTAGGLNQFDIELETFTRFGTDDGLPNNVIYGILPDDRGNLWVSTNHGLSTFNPGEMHFRNYDVQDGLQSNEFNTGAYFRSQSGELFFGGINGLNHFYPKQITDNPNPPEIVLTGFSIDGREITHQNSPGIVDAPIPSTQNIRVSHNEDVLTFQFAALDFSAPGKNQYAYKMEGLSENWVESGNHSSAVFTNLRHGEYTLRIKASNNDGIWNEAGISIGLIVTPPWWHTWWAYAGYGLLFFIGFYSLRRYELNRYQLKTQLELERVQTESLRKLDHLKSQFFANISHEFRTPLTLILGQIETVLTSKIDRNEKRKLEMATKNANRLLSLINQLLDLSKLESGKMEINSEQHNIVSFLKSLLYSFETLAESKEIELYFQSESESIPVRFDADKLEQVFVNLITNAFKFTEPGGQVSLSVSKNEKHTIEIRVKDTGIGIPENHLNNIFDRFYQVDSSTTRIHEGSGIGLALVYEFIKLHNGDIEAESHTPDAGDSLQSGTEFIIHLPIGKITNKADFGENAFKLSQDEPGIDPVSAVSKHHDLKLYSSSMDKELLLIVEDNAEVREFIREQLQDDYRILEAENGSQGLEFSLKEIPDLIISDLMMPQMDGEEFCLSIRNDEKTSHIPIIMLTARAGLENKLRGLESGIDAYLTKPFKVKELQLRVRKLIEQREKLRKQFSESGLISTSNVTDNSEKEFLEKAISVVEENFTNNQFKVNHLAGNLNMSPSQLNRKLTALVDKSAVQFMISVRLQHAANLLQGSDKTVAEISYEIGYNDQAYFTRAFKKQFGISPTEYRKKLS